MTKQKQTQIMHPGGRIPRMDEVCGDRPPPVRADLHGDGTWPGDDQAGSAGPPPGFEPDDPEGIPPPDVHPADPLYQGDPSAPPAGFEPPDPDAPPDPLIEPTDPLYQGPVAETPPGFEEPEAPWEPGGEKPVDPPPETLPGGNGEDSLMGTSADNPHPLV